MCSCRATILLGSWSLSEMAGKIGVNGGIQTLQVGQARKVRGSWSLCERIAGIHGALPWGWW